MRTQTLNKAGYRDGLVALAGGLVVLVFILGQFHAGEVPWTTLALSVPVFLLTLILLLQYRVLLLLILAFVIPLSIQIPVLENSKMSVPAEPLAILLCALLVAKLFSGFRISGELLKHPITWIIAADLAWMFIASVNSQMPEVSFKRFIMRSIFYSAFYLFYFEMFSLDKKSIRSIFMAGVLGLLLPVFYTLWRHYHIGFEMVGSPLISAPFYFDHTIYGAVLAFYLPFVLGAATSYRQKHKGLLLAVLLILTIAIWFSFSRAAWLSLIVAASFYMLTRISPIARIWFFGVLIVGTVISFSLVKISDVLKENRQISHTNNVGMHVMSVANTKTDASNKERINRWKCALRMFADKPLMGFGPGTYQFFYGSYQHRVDLTRISTFTGNKGHAHSEYLNYLSESGFPALIIFVVLIIFVIRTGWRLIMQKEDKYISTCALFLSCSLITFYIHGFFNGFLEFDKMAFPVFSSLAALVALDVEFNKIRLLNAYGSQS